MSAPIIIEVRLPDDQLETQAGMIAARLPGANHANGWPLSVSQAAAALGWSRNTLYRRIEAGQIKTEPNAPRVMIPPSEISRLLHEPQPGGDGQ